METKEHLAGYFLVNAENQEEPIRIPDYPTIQSCFAVEGI